MSASLEVVNRQHEHVRLFELSNVGARLESGRPPERNLDTKTVDRWSIESGRPPELNRNTKHDSGQPLEWWNEQPLEFWSGQPVDCWNGQPL
jgi:hypothetical protein